MSLDMFTLDGDVTSPGGGSGWHWRGGAVLRAGLVYSRGGFVTRVQQTRHLVGTKCPVNRGRRAPRADIVSSAAIRTAEYRRADSAMSLRSRTQRRDHYDH
jgi:hypothetical protein